MDESGDKIESIALLNSKTKMPKSNILDEMHRYTINELFPILLNKEREVEPMKICPSTFNREMQLSSEERLRKLAYPLRKCDVLFGHQTPLPQYFKPSPRIIIFQNFELGKVYNAILCIQNTYETLKAVRLVYEESCYFSVTYGQNTHTRVAPGMSFNVVVQFRPEEKKDYTYQVSFATENQSFVVPIIAIGPRPMLDFPDDIYVPPGPVKINNTLILVVRNIGEVPAIFSLHADSPFSVEPVKGVLRTGELMHVSVSVIATKVGDVNGFLTVTYDSGDALTIMLHTSAENINVRMDIKSLKMDDTFLGMKRQRSLRIRNDSDHLVQFKWKQMATVEEEVLEANKLTYVFGVVKEMESKKSMKLVTSNIIDPESHAVVYERIYDDEVKALQKEDYPFTHRCFSFFPSSGEIWPHSWSDIMVVFEPNMAVSHSTEAFCDIAGREERMPLKITGVGIGPCLTFNLDSLNIGHIFLSTTHCYEVVVKNCGLIEGTIIFLPSELKCGGELSCTPDQLSLLPEGYGTLAMSFSSEIQGSFREEIPFKILESDEILKIELKGEIVSPSIHFDVAALNLGVIAIGFPSTFNVVLLNPSLVPVSFTLTMQGDGYEPSLSYTDYAALENKMSLSTHPKEFIIEPSEGIVDAYSSCNIKLTVIANMTLTHEVALVANMKEYRSDPTYLPVLFDAQHTDIVCTTSDINLRFCFMNYPYARTITLENKGQLPGFFTIVPQQVTSYTTMTFSTSVSQGVLNPLSVIKVPLTIMTNSLGKQSLSISMLVMGEGKVKKCVNLVCNGQGPVVSVTPHFLSYGSVQLLEPSNLQLTLTNDSPVPADFMASVSKPKSPWRVFPEKGVLYFEESAILNVSVFLKDTGLYKDSVLIQVHNSRSLMVNMTAEGVGTSLVLNPPICPIYNMGPVFSRKLIRMEFTIRNKGTRHHQLVWSSQRDIKEFSRAIVDVVSHTIFTISPMKVDIDGGGSAVLVLEGQSDIVQDITEIFFCHAIINNAGKKQMLMSSKLMVSFIEPKVSFSKSELFFRLDVGPNNEFKKLEETIEVKSLSNLAHKIILKIDFPFMMKIDHSEEEIAECVLSVGKLVEISVTVVFNPSHIKDLHSWVTTGYFRVLYEEHPNVDSCILHGEINFPNVSVTPNIVDFGCIPIGSESCMEFELANVSPLPVSYVWYWLEEGVNIILPGPVKDPVHVLLSKTGVPPEEEEFSKMTLTSEDLCPANAELSLASEESSPANEEFSLANKETSPASEESSPTNEESSPANKESSPANEEPSHTNEEQKSVTSQVDQTLDLSITPYPSQEKKLTRKSTESFPVKVVSMDTVKRQLFPLVSCYVDDEGDISALEELPVRREGCSLMSKFFTISPFYGNLDPYERQIISVSFNGYKYVSAEIQAMCKVEGGPSVTISVIGQASNIYCHLNRTVIDFGHKLFYKPCSDILTLYNLGPLGLHFKADTVDVPLDGHLLPGMLIMTPKSGHILGHSLEKFTVQYLPGMSGRFQKTFHLQIGFLDPITIEVVGFGSFPQLYMYLPRPPVSTLPPLVGYKAITMLADHWMAPKKKIRGINNSTESVNNNNIPESELKDLQENDWDIISFKKNNFPTYAEIELEVEKVLAYQHVEDNPYIVLHHSLLPKKKTIPQFLVPPYIIDVGVVLVNTTVSYSALMYNYGPLLVSATIHHTATKSCLKKKGIYIKFRDIIDLPADQTSALHILFNPSRDFYTKQIQELSYIFYIEVVNGAKIPIYFSGIVTVPFLTFSTTKIDFETVCCGECKEFYLIVKNEGLVPCKWNATLQNKPRRNKAKRTTSEPDEENSTVFSFRYWQDCLLPKQETYVELFFQPISNGLKEMILVLSVENNLEKFQVNLKGLGLEPSVDIVEPLVDFDPILPYPMCEERVFSISNPCPFQIEVFFPTMDSQMCEEDRIIRVLSHYYQTEQIYLPPRNAGEKLPAAILDFYSNLAELVCIKEEEAVRSLLEETMSTDDKKSKKKQGLPKFGTARTPPSPIVEIIPDADHVEQLIHEYIEELQQSKDNYISYQDPVKAALSAAIPVVNSGELPAKNGILIVFHGSPLTDHVYAAHKTAMALDLTVLNIDQIILEAAAFTYTIEAMKVRNILQSSNVDREFSSSNVSSQNVSETKMKGGRDMELLEELTRLLGVAAQNLSKKGDAEFNSRSQRKADHTLTRKPSSSQQSSQSNRRGGPRPSPNIDITVPQGTLLGIPSDLLVEILKKRFQMDDCRKGVVMDSLTSQFFISAPFALQTVLRAAGNLKFIQCILLFNSFKTYQEWLEKEKIDAEEKIKTDYEAKLQLFETLDEESVESLSEDDMNLYIQIMLKKRNEKFIEKKEEMAKWALQKKTYLEQMRKSRMSITKPNVKKLSHDHNQKKQRISGVNDAVGMGEDKKVKLEVDDPKKKLKTKGSLVKLQETDGSTKKAIKGKMPSSGKASSNKSGGQSSTGKDSTEMDEDTVHLKRTFAVFENEFSEVLTIVDNWDKKKGIMIVTQEKSSSVQHIKGKPNRRSKRISDSYAHAKSTIISDSPTMKRSSDTLRDTVVPELKVECGVCAWLMDCRDPSKPKGDAIASLLINCSHLEEAKLAILADIEESKHLKHQEPIIFSFLTVPPDKKQIISTDIFVVSSAEAPDLELIRIESSEETSELQYPEKSITSTPRGRNIRKKRRKSSEVVGLIKKDKISHSSSLDLPKLKSRLTLAPGEKLEWKVRFDPHAVGECSYVFPVQITGFNKTFNVEFQGLCDLPRIDMDPHVLFSNVDETRDTKKLYKCTYFTQQEIFDFGAVMTAKPKDKRLHSVSTEITISNCSTLTADVEFSYLDKIPEKVDAFGFEPNYLSIEPGCSQPLIVYASPHLIGSSSETIVCSIKNNPVLELIKVTCQGVKLDFDVDPKVILFEHMLLYRKASRTLTLNNKCLVPLLWRFVGVESFELDFVISDMVGRIPALEKQEIVFYYNAIKVQAIVKKPLRLEVYDDEGRGDPVHVETILINAETIDVIVDIAFSESHSHVAFDMVKVGYEYEQPVILKNKGKHDLTYKIMIEKLQGLPVPDFPQMVHVSPVTGTIIHGDKSCIFNVLCTPTYEFDVSAVPILKCYIEDRGTIVTIIPISVSITSFYSRHKVSPIPDVNFGALTVGTKRTMELIIENIGLFDFKYTVLKTEMPGEEEIKTKPLIATKGPSEVKKSEDRADSKVAGQRGKGKSKVDISMLTVGVFTLSYSSGIVQPDQTAMVYIECFPEEEGTFCEEIRVFFSEASPSDKAGTAVQLSAVGSIPAIDFTNLQSIFHENFICQSLRDFECPLELGSHCVYVKDEDKLWFRRVCIGTKATSRLQLRNPGLVSCEIGATLLSMTKGSMKSNESVFGLSTTKLIIQPYSTEMLEVTFTPVLMEMNSSTLELTLDMLQLSKPSKLLVKLCGEGCVPMVAVTSPASQFQEKRSPTSLVFSPTLLGQSSTQEMTFKNIGIIPCKVIVELYQNADGLFSLAPNEETIPLLKIWVPDESIKRSTIVVLPPGRSATFLILFEPREAGRFPGEVKLFIVDNPFENLSVPLHGEGYTEDLTFDSLPMIYQTTRLKNVTDEYGTALYHLDFGSCYVSKSQRLAFKISNHSKMDVYRFQFEDCPVVTFSPNLSHLKPQQSKECVVTLLSNDKLNFNKTMYCSAQKIIYATSVPGTSSWDDRLTSVQWVISDDIGDACPSPSAETSHSGLQSDNIVGPSVLKEVRHKELRTVSEPEYEAVAGSGRNILILVTAVVDYTSISCDLTNIDFRETLMFQNRIFDFQFNNNGTVPLDYVWSFQLDEDIPMRLSSMTLVRALESLEESMSNDLCKAEPNVPQPPSDSYLPVDLPSSRSSLKRVHSGSRKRPQPKSLPYNDFFDTIPESPDVHPAVDLSKRLASTSVEAVSEGSSMSDMKSVYMPFQVNPKSGTLQPGEEGTCTLSFAPLDVFDYKVLLTCRVPYLGPDANSIEIAVTASSLMPFCHFDVEESDYVSGGRRDPALPGPFGHRRCLPLDSETRIIEFKVLGIGATHSKTFNVINPTEVDYTFSWYETTAPNPNVVSAFHCTLMDGRVASGKQTEVTFSFTAYDVGTFESFWNFVIVEHNIVTPFLVVAVVTEPTVAFLTSHISLPPTLVGIPVTKHMVIVNSDDLELHFSFVVSSLFSEGRQQRLKLNPMTGILLPNNEASIQVEFTPTSPGDTTFQLKCNIKSLKNAIELGVKGHCYIVQPIVTYEYDKNVICSLDANTPNTIDLGEVVVKCPATLTFRLTNIGKTSYYYNWKYNEEQMKTSGIKLNFSERGGHVTSQSRIISAMNITFSNKATIKDFKITLMITRGPYYTILLKGFAAHPAYHFSFSEYNFGPCIFRPTSLCQYHTNLLITNQEDVSIGIECYFINQPHITVDDITGSILSKQTLDVPITFHPRARTKYEDTIEFILNGTYKKAVKIFGEGIYAKVELIHPEHKSINLGALHAGQTTKFVIPVTNKSRAPVSIMFSLAEQLKTPSSSSLELEVPLEVKRYNNALQVLPNTLVLLKPKDVVNVEVHFAPKVRMQPFTEQIIMMFTEEIKPLCIVKGSCYGSEFSLDRQSLPFGAVVNGCSSTLKLVLMNTGDIGARFSWQTEKWNSNFSISPEEGYCSPGTTVTFIVTFHPLIQNPAIRSTVQCNIEKYKPLEMTMTGSSIPIPSPREIVLFVTPVRQEDKKSIVLTNKAGVTWTLFPIISGEYFYGQECVSIPSQKTVSYEVRYAPLAMSGENKHEGSVFFRLPDGQGWFYELVGVGEAPLVSGKISREVPCKIKHTELLPIANWLRVPQRFHMLTESMKAEKYDPVYSLSGNDFIDVPGNSEREYRLHFHSYRDCNLSFKVTFTNLDTGEYLFYDLNLKVVKSGPLDVIKISSCVRVLSTYKLKVENPLTFNLNFYINCNCPDVQVPPAFTIPANTEKHVMLEYLPMNPGEYSGKVEVQCPELGVFPYELNLTALPALNEKPLFVTTFLGSTGSVEAIVHNLTKVKSDFSCNVDSPGWHVDRQVSVSAFNKNVVEVMFEPIVMGSAQATLTATSPVAGEFVFPLFGTCTAPKPQGPFAIKQGSSVTIPFKNIFRDTKTFNLIVDNPVFVLKSTEETIKSKKEQRITVSVPSIKNLEVTDLKFPVMSKLIVTCTDVELSHITWTYYLKGIMD